MAKSKHRCKSLLTFIPAIETTDICQLKNKSNLAWNVSFQGDRMWLYEKFLHPWPCLKDQPKSFVKHPRSVNEARVSVLQSEHRLSSIIKLWIMITLLPINLALNSVNHSMGSLSAKAPGMRIQIRPLELKIKARFQIFGKEIMSFRIF